MKNMLDVPALYQICQPYIQDPNETRKNIDLAEAIRQDCSDHNVLARGGKPPSAKTIAVLIGHMRKGNYSYEDALARKPW